MPGCAKLNITPRKTTTTFRRPPATSGLPTRAPPDSDNPLTWTREHCRGGGGDGVPVRLWRHCRRRGCGIRAREHRRYPGVLSLCRRLRERYRSGELKRALSEAEAYAFKVELLMG
ncbi:hypothetical protein VPH35_104546 [Triticum aestivum]|uniref:uncharacterized protein n=1 Tax=Triticum aestivum TaxID=4565 RepID=UPI001D003A1D|nr:uncharacterized protein LOC123127329 [Triticum aestivum]